MLRVVTRYVLLDEYVPNPETNAETKKEKNQ